MVMAEYVARNRTPIRVGFYDIIRTIGRGNFAVVKLARHRITKIEVAIKIIDKLRLDQLNLKKIYREIQILKLLHHQHIIKLYQVMETTSKIYLVCEYARNGELFDYITEQGRLSEDEAKKMFWQVLTAVEYCHKNNVVHRDLKAENLLLDSNNNIKLADFGFSNFYQSGNMLSTWCGSPPYAAPEVFEGKLYDGPHLDIWSLGVVLYVLVCGTFPFDGSNLATLKERVLGGRFRIPYWMSQDCENLVRHMLVINPKKRLTITQIKKHKWMQECVTGSPLSQAKNSPKIPRRGKLSEYNEHVLKLMQGLGINRQKIIESLSLSAYDHLYAIYHLLGDRLKLHRTSFPLEGAISFDGGRRRPSNVADQALSSMTQGATPGYTIHNEFDVKSNYLSQDVQYTVRNPDAHFDEITAGLPTVQHSMATPIRYASPPLPQICTSMYDESSWTDTISQNTSYVSNRNEDSSVSNQHNQQFLSVMDYPQKSAESDQPQMGNYNLYQRRHTLMVPNPSQMQMLRAGLSTGQHISPNTSASKLSNSGEEVSQNYSGSSFHGFNQTCACDGPTCNDQRCGFKQTGTNLCSVNGNLLLPCKNLPTSSEFINFNHHQVGMKSQMRRRSGVPNPIGNSQATEKNSGLENDTVEGKVAFIIRQRQQLDTSPIGFRQGRRASDGLLLLKDNLLKEHLQKLAQASAVPEDTSEESSESVDMDKNSWENNCLQIPNHTSVNRTKSAEKGLTQLQTSPNTTPKGSGSNISYQPYNNNQSLARRRSLHVQQIQRSVGSSGSQHYEGTENIVPNANQPYAAKIPSPLVQEMNDRSGYPAQPSNEPGCHWSSWKPVQGTSPTEGTESISSTMWQQLSMIKSSGGWTEGDSSTLAVASDEAVSSKSTTAQDQQRDTKPVRQQSLPITPTTSNHPFANHQHPSMAQILQQRRLQRRLKVAATNLNQVPGYQLPLPEIEHLKIDSNMPYGQSHDNAESSTQNATQLQTSNEQEWADQQHYWSAALNKGPAGFPAQTQMNFDQQHGLLTASSNNQSILTNTIPVSMINSSENPQFSWSYDLPNYYKKSFDFDSKSLLVAETLSNSAERLDHTGSESMEFAMY